MDELELVVRPDAVYLEQLQAKHRKLQGQIEKYKRSFYVRYNDQSQLVVSGQLYDAIECIRLDLDAVAIELAADLDTLKLSYLGITASQLFQTMLAIQESLTKRNRALAGMCDGYRTKEELEPVKSNLCQYCMKHTELAKLKDLLHQTTLGTHEFCSIPQSTAEDLEQDLKKLDLDKFYGSDQEALMKKISVLLNEKAISLSRKAAGTEQTLQGILADLFNKNSDTALYGELSEVDEPEIDVADELTNAVRSELLKNAGQPLKKYIDVVSESKFKKYLQLQDERRISCGSQTTQVKSIQQIKALEWRLRSATSQIEGRKRRTLEVEKELMNEILELDKSKRRILELETKLADQERQIKAAQLTKSAYQSDMQRLLAQKETNIALLKQHTYQQLETLRKELRLMTLELESTRKQLKTRKRSQILESIAIQTIVTCRHQQTQTSEPMQAGRPTLAEGIENIPPTAKKDKKAVLFKRHDSKQQDELSQGSFTDQRFGKDHNSPSIKAIQAHRSLGKFHNTSIPRPILKNTEMVPRLELQSTRTFRLRRETGLPGGSSRQPQQDFQELDKKPDSESNSSREVSIAPQRKLLRYQTQPSHSAIKPNQYKTLQHELLDSNQPLIAEVSYEPQPTEMASKDAEQVIKHEQDPKPIDAPKEKPFTKEKTLIKKLSRALNRHSRPLPAIQLCSTEQPHHESMLENPANYQTELPKEMTTEEKIQMLKEVLVRQFDFLQKIGIVDMLQHLRVKKVERLGTYPNSNKRRDSYLMMHPMKVNYPQGADIPFKFCSSDLELFGGYQGAVKFTLKRGVYQNDYLNVDTYAQPISRIIKSIDYIEDFRKAILIKNFLVNPIETVIHANTSSLVRSELLKASLKRIFKFHSFCKPRCDHIQTFFRKHGLEV